MKILITSGDWSAASIVMESLSKAGHEVYVLDKDIYCAAFRSKYCKQGIICAPEEKTTEYINSISDILRSQHFDLIIPISDRATQALSDHRARIEDFVKLMLPPKELVDLALYKDKTYAFAAEKNIPIPKTYFPQTVHDLQLLCENLKFPCVAKRSRGTANKGNFYFSNSQHLMEFFKNQQPGPDWPMVQEYIHGDYYGFLGVADRGALLDCVMYKTEQKYALSGTAPYCLSIYDKDFLKLARRIIELLGWSGAINMDFLKDLDGQLRLLEINPRLSGSLDFSYSLGVDLPAIYANLAAGRTQKTFENINYQPQIQYRFVLPAEIILAMQNKGYWGDLLLNFLRLKMKTNIPWHDPMLLWWKLRHVWWYWQDRQNGILLKKEKMSPNGHVADVY